MGHPISVLHVDDDPSITDLTATFLERENDRFTVETATSANEGLETLADRPPDCVVSDYNMPGVDGIEFLRAVREDHPDLPFILYTGKGSEAVASEAIAANVTDYLQKGSGSEQYELLANRIRNAVQARRETERADRQEQLMRLTEFAGDTGGFEIQTETGELLLTDGVRRIYDLSAQADISLDEAINLYHPEDQADLRQAITRAGQTGEQTHGTWRLQPADGDERVIDISFTRIDSDGDTEILRGAVHDVTEQNERQAELRRKERRLNAILEHSTDRLSITDAAGRYTFVSPSVETLTGHNPADLIGEEAFKYVHPEDREETRAAFQQILDDPDGIYTVEYRYRDAEGSWRWIESRGTNRLHDPAIEGVVTNSREITERKQREQESQRTHDLMANMEQLADAGAWEYDPGTETVMMTGGACRIHGLEPDADPTLADAFGSFHPEDRDLLRDRFDTCLETGEPYEIDVRLTTPDGDQRWITARGERVTADGNGSVVRGYIQDITEQKQLERDLKQERDLVSGIVETVPIGLSVVDADGSISFVNERLESIGGRSLEELEDMPHDDARYDLVDEHGEPLESGETPFNRVASRETAIHNQVVGIRRPSGERVWLSVSGAPQYDDGELERTVFAFEDITEQRELEAEMSEILGRVSDAFFALDEELRVTHVNSRGEELLEASEDQLLGETLWDMYTEVEESDEIWDSFRAAMDTQDSVSLEFYSPGKNWYDVTVYPSESGLSVYFQDVTERKNREEDLEELKNQ